MMMLKLRLLLVTAVIMLALFYVLACTTQGTIDKDTYRNGNWLVISMYILSQDDVTLYIDSPGGDINGLRSIESSMGYRKAAGWTKPVKAVCVRLCGSAAALTLVSAGEWRGAPGSIAVFHLASAVQGVDRWIIDSTHPAQAYVIRLIDEHVSGLLTLQELAQIAQGEDLYIPVNVLTNRRQGLAAGFTPSPYKLLDLRRAVEHTRNKREKRNDITY